MLPVFRGVTVLQQVTQFVNDHIVNNTMRCKNDAPIVGDITIDSARPPTRLVVLN